jgi:ribonucleoside-diphosphate reductase alpha chain
VEEIQDIIEEILIREGHVKTAKAFILYRQKRTEEREAKTAVVGHITKTKLTLNALRVLKERYLIKDDQGNPRETPEDMFLRVAKNIASADRLYGKKSAEIKETEKRFYDMMVDLDFLPNSPTLMNAGTDIQQLAACFVLPIEDSMEGIFESLKNAAIIHKSGGGTGFSFSRLRGRNSPVKSTQGVASGPISFLHVYNAATEVIKQGGKRRGANMGVLRIDHPDILDFINCKEKNDAITNFNISVAVTDKFMKAVENNEEYDLVDPRSKEVVQRLKARSVFDQIVSAAWRNGDPGIIFIDRMNKDNPTPEIGEIESTNPCGEQPLLPYEACNLGSINLGNFVVGKKIDWDRLAKTVHGCVHFLDNVIDMGNYPLPRITEMVKGNRKIGLGVMGWADLLCQLEIPYNSEDGVKKAEKVISFIRKEADLASQELAKERGTFPNFKKSVYNRPGGLKYRNATRLTIAPTGTIGMIADCSGGVEPLFALSYTKRVMDGKEFFYIDKNFRKKLEEKGLFSEDLMEKVVNQGSIQHIEGIPDDIKQIFVVAHDITPYWHVRMQAAVQKSVDNAVSKTVNFPKEATLEDVDRVYMLAWKTGCKGITIYRDQSKGEQVLNLNINIKKDKAPDKSICPQCGGKMKFSEGCASCMTCGYSYCISS